MNTQDASTYQSYLLRLWRDTPQSAWRASIQSTATEAVQHFATVEELWAFLMAHTKAKDDVVTEHSASNFTESKESHETFG